MVIKAIKPANNSDFKNTSAYNGVIMQKGREYMGKMIKN
jgi:hypothetical protein|tara:strand:+ start:304 stop:420 length:117 start_codon:yes stop_codon:yes gene_type:complete